MEPTYIRVWRAIQARPMITEPQLEAQLSLTYAQVVQAIQKLIYGDCIRVHRRPREEGSPLTVRAFVSRVCPPAEA